MSLIKTTLEGMIGVHTNTQRHSARYKLFSRASYKCRPIDKIFAAAVKIWLEKNYIHISWADCNLYRNVLLEFKSLVDGIGIAPHIFTVFHCWIFLIPCSELKKCRLGYAFLMTWAYFFSEQTLYVPNRVCVKSHHLSCWVLLIVLDIYNRYLWNDWNATDVKSNYRKPTPAERTLWDNHFVIAAATLQCSKNGKIVK